MFQKLLIGAFARHFATCVSGMLATLTTIHTGGWIVNDCFKAWGFDPHSTATVSKCIEYALEAAFQLWVLYGAYKQTHEHFSMREFLGYAIASDYGIEFKQKLNAAKPALQAAVKAVTDDAVDRICSVKAIPVDPTTILPAPTVPPAKSTLEP